MALDLPWLDWLNTAPLGEIDDEICRVLGPEAMSSTLRTRVRRALARERASGRTFSGLDDLAGSRGIGKSAKRLMLAVLQRHGYVAEPPPCAHCPHHCPGAP